MVVVAGGATALAYAVHQPRGSAIGAEMIGGSIAGLLPAMLFDSITHPAESSSGTVGQVYSNMGRSLGKLMLVPIVTVAPALTTYLIGNEMEGDTNRAGRSAITGYVVGGVIGLAGMGVLSKTELPSWARVSLTAVLIGAGTTLGYQLGR